MNEKDKLGDMGDVHDTPDVPSAASPAPNYSGHEVPEIKLDDENAKTITGIVKTSEQPDGLTLLLGDFAAINYELGHADGSGKPTPKGDFSPAARQRAYDKLLAALASPKRESRLHKVEELLRHARSLSTVRYQAYQYVKEGEPGYAAAGDLAVEATQHLRRVEEVIRQAQDMLPGITQIEDQGEK